MLVDTFGAYLDFKDLAGKTLFDSLSIKLETPAQKEAVSAIKNRYLREKEQEWDRLLSTEYETNCSQVEFLMQLKENCISTLERQGWKVRAIACIIVSALYASS